ncbi:MAG: NAD(P)H-dependent oxidoreductase [Clostridiales bacterium]|nr:NAD(P)H-dependent oxidoreductase [Clostridiales bacterium]
MKYVVVNGSPRGKKSNSDRIISWMTQNSQEVQKVYVADIKKHDEAMKVILDADRYLMVFPLYTDAMPGMTKAFMEKMQQINLEEKSIVFVVHSGFSEPIHSRTVERYCAYFTKANKMKYLGCVVMGGSEAMQVAPNGYFGKKKDYFEALGQNIMKGELLDQALLQKIAGAERFSKFKILILRFLPTDMYWNSRLKKNGAYEKRLDKPYS